MYYQFMIIFFALFSKRLIAPNSTFYTSIPIQNSIEVPGQDEETNKDLSFPSLIAIHCKKKHGAQTVIKFAKSACKKLKKKDFWETGPIGWFRTYPVVYTLCRSADGFEIMGNPYYLYPMFRPLFAVPGSHTDYIVVNEHCQLVGAVIWSKVKVPITKEEKKKIKPFHKPTKGFTKCMIEMTP